AHRLPRRRLGRLHPRGRRAAPLPRRGAGHRRQAHDREERPASHHRSLLRPGGDRQVRDREPQGSAGDAGRLGEPEQAAQRSRSRRSGAGRAVGAGKTDGPGRFRRGKEHVREAAFPRQASRARQGREGGKDRPQAARDVQERVVIPMKISNLKFQILFILISACGFANAKNVDLSTVPKRSTVALTIYNSEDLTLVRETRTVTFKKGVNPLQFSWANTLIDPTSVELKFITKPEQLDVLDTTFPHDKPQMLYWNVQSDFDGEATIEITYFTSGITWSADYVAIADKD